MTRKLLIGLVSLLTISFSAFADDITGIYVGTLHVSFGGGTDMENTEIYLEKDGDNYKLSVKNFEFGGKVIGDLDVPGITRSEEAGIVVLSKEGSSPGPVVELVGNLNTFIYFTSATIDNGELELELKVNGKNTEAEAGTPETFITNVTFKGQKTTSGVSSFKAEPLNITVASGIISINKADNTSYVIYNISGSVAQSGVINENRIDATDLRNGIYILSVNGKAIKFVK